MDDWSMKCKKCGGNLGGLENAAASICVRPMGDEEDRTYFLCEKCDVYTVWVCIEDFFTDECKLFAAGPIPRKRGDEIVAKIRQCPAPGNMSCKCPVHKEMEGLLWW